MDKNGKVLVAPKTKLYGENFDNIFKVVYKDKEKKIYLSNEESNILKNLDCKCGSICSTKCKK